MTGRLAGRVAPVTGAGQGGAMSRPRGGNAAPDGQEHDQ